MFFVAEGVLQRIKTAVYSAILSNLKKCSVTIFVILLTKWLL